MDKEQLSAIIKTTSKDGKISCEQALKIASETDTPSKEVGLLLNELKIKVMSCQLGCFP